MPEIVGRDEELAAIDAFLDAAPADGRALLLRGEAGVGKTTLWRAGVDAAGRRGLEVLVAQPAEAEASLPFAALADLLDGVAEEVLAELPEPQANALRAALLLDGAAGAAPDRWAVAVAVLNALRALARSQPILVAVDDAQWLDAPTAGALEFAVRRLHGRPVALLIAARGPESSPPLSLERALPEDRLLHLEIGGLSFGALHELLRRRVGRVFARPLLRRLHETSNGNPFFALELARALDRRGAQPVPGAPLPVPDSLQQLLRGRLEALPTEARDALLVSSALGSPTREAVAAALTHGGDDAVETAVRAGVLEVEDERVRVAHPLLASSVYAATEPRERRSLHRRLADVAAEPEERARHLALASEGPDAQIAAELEEAAASAIARGAPETAAELLEQARALTPSDQPAEAWRRSIGAVESYLECGGFARARTLLEGVISASPTGGVRARALQLLGCAISREAGPKASLPLYKLAAAEVVEPSLKASIEADVAMALRLCGDVAGAAAHGEAAVALAEQVENPWLLRDLLVGLAADSFVLGQSLRADLLERAAALGAGSRPELFQDATYFTRSEMRWALLFAWLDQLEPAREKLGTLLRYVTEEHLGDFVPYVLSHSAQIECVAGNWERALRRAEACEEAAMQVAPVLQGQVLHVRAFVAAHRGQSDEARAAARQLLEVVEPSGNERLRARCHAVLGFLELSLGDAAAADVELSCAGAVAAAAGHVEPCVLRFHHDHVEALVALGELARAEELVGFLEWRARPLRSPWIVAVAARCRGLVAGAHGDISAAGFALEEALEAHDRLADSFERARTLLAFGAVQRRAKRKRAARDALGEALERFERLGSPLWADRARAELARIGGRTASGHRLTPTEQRVAELVGTGRSNKEVAAALFVTPRTVEKSLSRIYAKLGVRSRTELAHKLSGPVDVSKV